MKTTESRNRLDDMRKVPATFERPRSSDQAIPPTPKDRGGRGVGSVLGLPPVPDLLGKDIANETDWQGPIEALLSQQGRLAQDVWTREDWTKLALHLHNDNGPKRFIMGFRQDGGKRYVRSKKLAVTKAISWSWSTICGTTKSPLAFVPYCTNASRESRWGALDFDAHDGDGERARGYAFAAFRRLLDTELFIILESSGAGWHVWAVSKDFHPVNEWIQLLKKVAFNIKAPIQPGVCEIFPPDTISHGMGKGMRAPGSWNPGTDSLNDIYWQNTEPLIRTLTLPSPSRRTQLTDIERNSSFPSSFSPSSGHVAGSLYQEWEMNWADGFSITSPSTRNDQLARLVGAMFYQVGSEMGARIAETQFLTKTVETESDLEGHLHSFKELWRGFQEKWFPLLSENERGLYSALQTEHERDAFRIILSYRRKAETDGQADFAIAAENLADRLGITLQGASKMRRKFVSLGIIALTQPYLPNKRAARYRWVPSDQPGLVDGVASHNPF